jgi:hypothetical protein
MSPETDLFGQEVVESTKRKTFASGYPRRPGSGPVGETCKTCGRCHRMHAGNKTFYKCGANQSNWTHSVNTDIRLKSPACLLWTQRYAKEATK